MANKLIKKSLENIVEMIRVRNKRIRNNKNSFGTLIYLSV
jgi:hypothetical protein